MAFVTEENDEILVRSDDVVILVVGLLVVVLGVV